MSRRAAQRPQDFRTDAQIAGAAAQPIATQGRSYRFCACLEEMQAMWEQLSYSKSEILRNLCGSGRAREHRQSRCHPLRRLFRGHAELA